LLFDFNSPVANHIVIRELRALFSDMISSPNSFVTPGQELARLTLISPSNEAAIRRRSTISAGRFGGLGELNGMPVLGPLGPPPKISESETQVPAPEPEKTKPASDEDSEATLVSNPVNTEVPLAQSDDKENEPPRNDAVMVDAPNETIKAADGVGAQTAQAEAGSTTKPPPVPPRPTPQVDPQRQIIEEVEIGAQQDVTEVINNVLFQSQCAIRGHAVAPDGEQLDQVKEWVSCASYHYCLRR
jgi:ubiquitin carboxyl-terminal hydrolase 25/28